MLTWEEDVEAAALRAQGWSISAIARHLGRDPKTIRAYLAGERIPGKRRRSAPDVFAPFAAYVTARLGEDRHVWATALYDEVVALGYRGSYPSFTRALRTRGLRPRCEACAGVKGRETVDIAHPPGEETQWDWLELPGAPWGGVAYVLVGALSYSSQARAVLAEAEDLPHLVEAPDGVARRFGGTTRRWRFDRMATVIDPQTGRLQPGFAAVAKHYQVGVDPCPPRRANRKGVVEKAIHFLTQRWWRTARLEAATQVQASLDRFCVTTGDARPRPGGRTVGELAETEPLRPCHWPRSRPPWRSPGSWPPTAWSPSVATTTRSRPGWSARPCRYATGWAASTWSGVRADRRRALRLPIPGALPGPR
jgi:transposase